MKDSSAEFIRYVINGLFAAVVHYAVLTFNVEVAGLWSAAVANGLAAIVGIATSFVGSLYFVFRRFNRPIMEQAARFAGLYATIALVHAGVLFVWTDVLGEDYRIGFLIATGIQFVLSYAGNKLWVFR